MSMQHRVIVIGAGIVGVASALHLQRQGHQVTLLDRQAPGEGTSYGNAGCLNSSSMLPVQVPGLIKKIPSLLRQTDGPLAVNYAYVMKRLPWFMNYLSHTSAARVEAIAAALAPLVDDCVAQYQALAQGSAAAALIQPSPYVFLYENKAAYEADRYGWELRRQYGVEWDVLQADEVNNLIPGLATGPWCAAVMRTKHGYLTDPGRLAKCLAEQFVQNGGTLLQTEAQALAIADNRVTGVHSAQGLQEADEIVIAAGVWSANLLKPLGVSLPLESERGYHLELHSADTQLRCPVMWTKGKCVFTPMDKRLRIAGTVEFAGLNAPLNPKRTDVLLRHSQTLFPKLRYQNVQQWLGHRPSLPDSLPAIGRLTQHRNVILAFGHQHIGMMTGPKTGRLVAELISGHDLSMNIQAFSPDRF